MLERFGPGMIVAVIYGLCVAYLGGPNTFPETFLSATIFLFWWYIATSIISGVIMVLVSLGILKGAKLLRIKKRFRNN